MIDILMATYNGERYISEQIESILNQTYKNWKLYIRDDGSKDNTKYIIKNYEKKYPNKIIVIEDENNGLGAKYNFRELMKHSTNEYCMFSDQDDIWLNNKIQITLSKMIEIESQNLIDTPILIHTDLKVVDSELNIIDNSFWKYQNLYNTNIKLNNLLVQNYITGCTMMLNKSLLNLAKNMPKESIMHDWWIGLVASTFGIIGYVENATILYRQHGNNEVGAQKYNSLKSIKSKLLNLKKINDSIENTIIQSEAFYNLNKEMLDITDEQIIKEFIRLKEKTYVDRKLSVIKNKFYKNGLIRNIGYLIFI